MISRLHFRLTVVKRFWLVITLAILIMAVGTMVSIVNFRFDMMEQRADAAKQVVDASLSVVQDFQDRAKNGLISDEEAREGAKSALRAIRYNGKDYVFALNMKGNFVVLAPAPEKEG